MRKARLIQASGGVYHITSRIIQKQFLLNDVEKERFRHLMWQLADFAESGGNSVLAWIAKAEEIKITCGPMQLGLPEPKELRAFQDKPVLVRTLAEPPEKATGRILHEQWIETNAGGSGMIQEPGPDGDGSVLHTAASR